LLPIGVVQSARLAQETPVPEADPDPCKLIDDWDSGDPDKRFDAMREHSRRMVASMGGDPDRVDYRREAPPTDPSRAAGYDREENVMYLNPGFTEGAHHSDTALDVTAHESRHAIQDQLEEDAGIPLEDTSNDVDQALREADARDFAKAYAEDARKACNLKKYGNEYGRRVIGADEDDEDDEEAEDNEDTDERSLSNPMPRDRSELGDWVLPPEDAANA
jgi:hypothetical protein